MPGLETRMIAGGFIAWRVVSFVLGGVIELVGDAIDAGCELFDLDGEDH